MKRLAMRHLFMRRLVATAAGACAVALAACQDLDQPAAPTAAGSPADPGPAAAATADTAVIVVLNAGPAPGGRGANQARAAEVARALGLAASHAYGAALYGFAARVPKGRLTALERDPQVAFVSADAALTLAGGPPRAGVERVQADASAMTLGDSTLSPSATAKGGPTPPPSPATQQVAAGVRLIGGLGSPTAKIDGVDERVDADVAVLDTGIQSDHPDLNVVGGVDCANTHGGKQTAEDLNGHGTNVAGIIGELDNAIGYVGVAPGARLWAVRVVGKNGNGAVSNLLCGLDWLTANAATIEVANLSLGAKGSDDGDCGRSKRDPVHVAVCAAVDAGVTLVVSAGNAAADASGFVPAAYDEVIAVSALADFDGLAGAGGPPPPCGGGAGQVDGTFATFSNFGADVDLMAPGVCVLGSYLNSAYAYVTGTSQAAPHVAGAAALYLAGQPGTSPAGVRAALVAARDARVVPGDPDGIVEGVVNVSTF